MESINSKLRPCPFCGGKAVLYVKSGVQVVCMSCGIGTSIYSDVAFQKGVSQERFTTSSIDKVIEEWNRRVSNV